MSDSVYVIRNQLGQYWARAGEWVDGREPQRLLKLRYHDEAVNQLVELSARDVDLRGCVVEAVLSQRGEPVVEASEHLTPTAAERAAAQAAERAAQAVAEAGAGGGSGADDTDSGERDTAAEPIGANTV
jgi:hypothetical protein